MASSRTSSSRRPIKKGGMFIPALCNVIGTLLIIAVIATSVPLAVPSLLGYEIYNVTSGSMEPELPVGSVIYVEHVKPESVQPGDIIVLAGKGHETYQEIMGVKRPFDEKVIVSELLTEMREEKEK